MPDTIAPVLVGSDQFYSVSSLTSNAITAGTACTLQNIGTYPVYFIVRATQPTATERGEVLPADTRSQGSVVSGENEIWLKGIGGGGYVSIQGA